MNGTKKLETGLDLKFGLVCLDDSADNGNVNVLGTNVVGRGHAGDVDICMVDEQRIMLYNAEQLTILASDLVLGNDDLNTVRVLGTRDGVLEDANSTDNLAFFDNTDLALGLLAGTKVAWVTDNLLGLHSLVTAPDTDELAISVSDNLVNGLIEHVGSSVDGTQTSERLGEFAKTVQGVDVWRLAITRHRRRVQDNTLVCWACGLVLVAALTHQYGIPVAQSMDAYSSVRYRAIA